MDEIHKILNKYWGFTEFRPLQLDVIRSVLKGTDTLALLPTGGGKTMCFQVPSILHEGICIVISPLVALMKDQVDKLHKKEIKAVAITSAMSKKEIDVALDNCVYGDYKFLYISPERIGTEIIKERVKKMKVNLIAVDEAHCISQWGYDFRPSYLKISDLRELHPNVPILALTATATPEVVKEIQDKLHFKTEHVLRKSFERKNLAYAVLHEEDKNMRLLKLINNVHGSGIVYVRNRKKTQELAKFLSANGVSADFYNAGINHLMRDQKQHDWISDQCRIMVCTNAFGMGIDKPDVRLVVHMDLPDCIESYFQEAGRAGRDGHKSFAILLYNNSDKIELNRNLKLNFPELDVIKQTYQALANHFQIPVGAGEGQSYSFDIADLCNKYNMNAVTVFSSLKFLEKEEYLSVSESLFQPSRVHLNVIKEDLYKFQVANSAYDDFIKLLLRSYGGIFDNYVRCNEVELAIRWNNSKEMVVKYLLQLDKFGILSYIPQTDLPQIIFIRPRVDSKQVSISSQHLKLRKQKAEERAHSLLNYATNPDKCRSQILLAYFGETNTTRCGICDYCRERNKNEVSNEEFENVTDEIKSLLFSKHLTLKDLITAVTGSNDNKILKVVQWLLDNGKLVYDGENRLTWKE